jgi:hypothetical protein
MDLESEAFREALILQDPKFLECLNRGHVRSYFTKVSKVSIRKVSELAEHCNLPGHFVLPLKNATEYWYYCPACNFRMSWDIQDLEEPNRLLAFLGESPSFEELLMGIAEFSSFVRIPSRFERVLLDSSLSP